MQPAESQIFSERDKAIVDAKQYELITKLSQRCLKFAGKITHQCFQRNSTGSRNMDIWPWIRFANMNGSK